MGNAFETAVSTIQAVYWRHAAAALEQGSTNNKRKEEENDDEFPRTPSGASRLNTGSQEVNDTKNQPEIRQIRYIVSAFDLFSISLFSHSIGLVKI